MREQHKICRNMKVFLYFNLLIYGLQLTNGGSQLHAVLYKQECDIYDRITVSDFNCSLVPDFRGIPTLNANVTFARDIDDLEFRFKLSIERAGRSSTLVSVNIDYCHDWWDMKSNVLLRRMVNESQRASNLPKECPLLKRVNYYFDRYNVSAFGIPSYVPEMKFISHNDFYSNHKRAFTGRFYGRVMRATRNNLRKLINENKLNEKANH